MERSYSQATLNQYNTGWGKKGHGKRKEDPDLALNMYHNLRYNRDVILI